MLTTDDKKRKETPIFSGVLMYFPDAVAEVARVSYLGNEKHNPGQPLHWSRGKSTDHLDSAQRHLIDAGPNGDRHGKDGRHLANVIWRALAKLQLICEAEQAAQEKAAQEIENADPPGPLQQLHYHDSSCLRVSSLTGQVSCTAYTQAFLGSQKGVHDATPAGHRGDLRNQHGYFPCCIHCSHYLNGEKCTDRHACACPACIAERKSLDGRDPK